MANVHHCPACELRFRFRTELEYHLAEEHAPPPDIEPEPPPPPGDDRQS